MWCSLRLYYVHIYNVIGPVVDTGIFLRLYAAYSKIVDWPKTEECKVCHPLPV